jgi:dTDP-D-glucose 4,6-dehydratase
MPRHRATVDRAFAADSSLAARFPDAPAASGKTSDTLKTYVTDRAGHDRRYAIDETKARTELGYAPRRTFAEGFTVPANTLIPVSRRTDQMLARLRRITTADMQIAMPSSPP